ncbi:isopeptide-forming domain-containing fimbrial protein [Coleofasciculus sp. FACHB-129]|uniref:beta strand repeat-containing protein n=1 Tax=Cyanophyceae TaxID=3028117 RepID=UPI0016865209|nr:isopeptide-forming domain-containing fimbrial protein [Coleofasciculus sp. FACHB-129]MBD1894607.1 isopeptide-forming domain-containing fimbrial protein [Coleofasciculus sp. FACHB-129]
MFFKDSQEAQGRKIEDKRNFSSFYDSLSFLFPSITLVAALVCYSTAAQAQTTTLPSSSGLNFQTSGPSRAAGVGDWYTTAKSNSPDRLHRFAVDITQAMITAGGGSVTITINDAESNGALDEINDSPNVTNSPIGTVTCTTLPSTCDPTRFELRTLNGVTVLETKTVGGPNGNNAANNTPVTFTVTQPGTYQVTSVTGAGPIFGDDTPNLNDDDNGFSISVPTFGLPQGQQALIGQFQGTVQQNTGSSLTVPLYFLVDPGTISLSLRNFDLDNGGTISYTRPTGGTITGTASSDAIWNVSNTLNPTAATGDKFTVSALTATGGDAGIWGLTVANFTNNNQTLFQAAGNLGTLPLFDNPPTRAGNFVITPSTTLATTIGNEVCHPFTVTNNFFTTDIINLNLTGTNPNYVAQFRDAVTGLPLEDTDKDGLLDTGILNPGQTKFYNLCVTPGQGATAPDVSQIGATSFMDRKVAPNSYQTREQFVTKTTTIPIPPVVTGTKSVALATDADGSGSVTAGDRVRYTISYTNTESGAANEFQITDALPTGLTLAAIPTVTVAGPGTSAAVNPAYNGAGTNTLLAAGAVLASNGTITVTVDATVGSGVSGNLFNQATATSTTPGFPPAGVPTDATTPSGSISQTPYGDTGPADKTGLTIGLVPVPVPTATKSVRFVTDNDGSTTLTIGDDVQYTIIVSNPTSSPINNLVISDVIPIQLLVLRNTVTIDGDFTLAASLPGSDFNGTGTPVPFTQPGTLAAGATVTLKFNARLRPGAANPITNQGRVNFAGDNGDPVLTDASDSTNPTQPGSGNNPGNPGNIGSGGNVNQPNQSGADPNILNFVNPVSPSGAKSVRLFTDTDNSGTVTTGDVIEYTITYINTAPNSVSNFLATDSIDTSKLSFVAGSYSFTFSGTGTTITGNSSYNGTTDTNLTNPTTKGQLGAGGGKVTIKFRATVTATTGVQIINQARATSTGGTVNNSVTDAVTGPNDLPQELDDEINQGNLGDTGDDDPTVLTVAASGVPRLRLVKRITNATRNGVPISGINFGSFVADPNDPNDDAPGFSQLSPVGVSRLGSETLLASGNEVDYTIYFLSDGTAPVNNVRFCDAIPSGTMFIADSFGSGSGISANQAGIVTDQTNASDTDAGTFFSPLAPLPAGNACSNQTNPDGAVILNLGTISNKAGSNFGFIRFRVKIN